jgi:hypothetical protein
MTTLGLSLGLAPPRSTVSGPPVSSIAPTSGNDRGGTSITITGSGFTGATSAAINGVNITSFLVVNDTTITGVTAAQAFGTRGAKNVTVVNGLTGTLAGGFTVLDGLSTAGCVLWLRADQGVTQVANAVSQWNDQSGTGDANKHVVQATGTAKPTLAAVSATYNNRSTISFDGGDSLIGGAWTASQATPFTIYIVGRQPTPTDGQLFMGDRSSAIGIVRIRNNGGSGGPNGSLHLNNGGADAFTTAGGIDWSAVRVGCITYDTPSSGTATGYVSRYSTTFCTATAAGTSTLTGTAIGSNAAGSGSFLIGEIAEIIIYSGAHNATTRQLIMSNYLGDAYAVSVTA